MALRRIGLFLVVSGALGGLCWPAAPAYAPTFSSSAQTTSASAPATAPDQFEIETLCGQIADPSRSGQTRQEAASLLLHRQDKTGEAALVKFLSDASNPSAQAAVAAAIAGAGETKQVFAEGLMAMLGSPDPAARAAAVAALGAYRQSEVVDRLIVLAKDASSSQQGRIAATVVLQQDLTKQVISTLVELTGDADAEVAKAAIAALVAMTGMDLGPDCGQWVQWWQSNKDKDWSTWLTEWAVGLNQQTRQLQTENAALRTRLGAAIRDAYQLNPPAQRDALLTSYLGDPVAEVRLTGLDLLERRLSANEAVADALRVTVRPLMTDPDPRVRRSATLVLANLRDGESVELMLSRLDSEKSPGVVEALLTALGLVGEPRVAGAVIAHLDATDPVIAAAAAKAVAAMAQRQPLTAEQQKTSSSAMIARYGKCASNSQDVAVREALLTAMGVVGGSEFLSVLQAGLADEASVVRLAAVKALTGLNGAASAELLAPLLQDSDRGVRQAAIVAIAQLGGTAWLDEIMLRTEESIEPDAAVRQQALDVAMKLLETAPPEVLTQIARMLAGRPDATEQRITVLKRLAALLPKPARKVDALRELGAALVQAGRPAEAVSQLSQAVELAGQNDLPVENEAWSEWVGALLAADDPAAIAAMAKQKDQATFDVAVRELQSHLSERLDKQMYAPVVALGGEALNQMPQRLNFAQREQIAQVLSQARKGQSDQDVQTVARLVGQLRQDPASEAPVEQLGAMGDRALGPLLAELKAVLQTEPPNPQLEGALVTVLNRISPRLTGYDASTSRTQKIHVVDGWIKSL